jgi:hypothetical protein
MGHFSDEIADHVNQRLTAVNHATDNPLVWRIAKKVSSAFAGGTTNAHGDDGGTSDPYTLFTVTGDVVIKAIWGICNVSLTGATATIEVGVTGNTAGLIAQETATEIDAGGVYVSATQAVGLAAAAGSGALIPLADGLDIIETVGTADVTAGQIDYYVVWAPCEPGASVVAA